MSLFLLNNESKVINFDITNGHILPLVRFLLAFSFLITLLCNAYDDLFPIEVMSNYSPKVFFEKINFFYVFRDNKILCYLLSISLLLITMFGFFPFITGVLQWYLIFSFVNISTVVDGGDQINSIICFLLIPINTLDFRLNQWKLEKTVSLGNKFVGYICYALIKIQVAIVYLHASVGKFVVPEWADGTAIYYWLQHEIYGFEHWNTISFIFRSAFFTSAITWGSVLLELLLFCAIFMTQKYKNYLFVLGILFHFLIFLFLGLFSFFLVMASALLIYLLPLSYRIITPDKYV
ncbi:hypothetical protein [Riemerella anatipestifer]|uniref:hypothetical protein n=1 Tax=Riemerella anatipestifer TaxID=34085 RepID=UPI001BD97B2B|nr:hypothetical protein [Riemerella anatipestifer]MBT0552351.1 hypothetical protein [Riemerella anatipestifer]MBT0554625.1 hypothetical protein [Riemerella anatipestifer]MCE3025081.1 hypothetical protein [Riemerella anatipestifer]MCU7543353.1 hypothetical protein [Riemerella anatipestifer]MCU7560726.1 hypothetical protein [Riemerella anatipestifer]